MSESGDDLYALRDMAAGDIAFVVSTWALSFADESRRPWWHPTREAWLSALRATSAGLARRCRTVVLCSPTEPGAVMGWACGEGGQVVWAYVRPRIRETEIGRRWAERMMARAKEAT